jgi:hypothetical protein
MPTFPDRVFAALGQFNGHLSTFEQAVQAAPPDPRRLPRKSRDSLLATAGRARAASDAIARSFTLVERTALDIVDMQVRLQGETARLASALRDLGDAVEQLPAAREWFGDQLVALDEAAQLAASAVFPSAVKGIRDVNVKLWEFEKIQWKRYTDTLTTVVQRGAITAEQQAKIQAIADDVARAFAEVNGLLNELAESRPPDAAALARRLAKAPARLMRALATAEAQLTPAFSMFAPTIRAAAKTAHGVAALLGKLTIPAYPPHDRLGECADCIEPPLYDSLSGVQAFALLNILARLQATNASGRPLLSGRGLRVVKVFPDRVYLEADQSLVKDMRDDRSFVPAPASLHRFKEGSFKQATFPRGNLQVCFASLPGGRVMVDADMDLYRSAVPHLFGEVLVNHLTGSVTNQYTVRRILDDQRVPAVGDFRLLTVTIDDI